MNTIETRRSARKTTERPASARAAATATVGYADTAASLTLEIALLREVFALATPDPTFTTLTGTDFVKVQKGELDANAAFMQGRMKVAGNMAKLMQLMPLTNSLSSGPPGSPSHLT